MPKNATAERVRAPRKRGSYAKTAETRGKILAAALEVAERQGVHGISLSQVALRAGVAVGNVSYHFGSRGDLLREVLQSVADQARRDVVLASVGGDIFERADAAIRAYLGFLHRHPSFIRMSEQVRLHHPDLYETDLSAWLELHCEAIREGIAEGSLRDLSEDEITATAHMIVGATYFLDQMIEGIGGRKYPGDDVVVAAYMKVFRGGLERSRRRTSAREKAK